MYCPNCSQQQAAGEARFCPRCGFALAGVRELMAGGGVPSLRAGAAALAPASPRQRGIRQGARLTCLSIALMPLVFAFCVIIESGIPFALPASLFLAGIFWMLYARLFGESLLPAFGHLLARPSSRAADTNSLAAAPPATALDAPHDARAAAPFRRPNSVTDHTTHLLD